MDTALSTTEKLYDLANLEREIFNLTKLVQINGIINSTLDIVKLLTIIMEIIKEIMEAEASTLLLYEEETEDLVFKVALGEAGHELAEKYRVKVGQGIAGWTAETRKATIVNDAYNDRRFEPDFDRKTGFRTRALISSPLLFKGRLLGVIQAINPVNRPGFDDEDLRLFNVFANQVALAVQNAIFFQDAIEEERIKSELRSAQSVQESLIPPIDQSFGPIDIAARTVPAREIGGEFHSLFAYHEGRVGLALGDIHEKGLSGGLHASISSGALKALARFRGTRPLDLVKLLRRAVSSELLDAEGLSVFYGIMDTGDNTLNYCNSGSAYPILIRDRTARYLRLGKPGGKFQGSEKSIRVKLRPGDWFVIMSDGILNFKNRLGAPLGLRAVMERLSGEFSDPADLISSLISFAQKHAGELGRREDISIIAIKVG